MIDEEMMNVGWNMSMNMNMDQGPRTNECEWFSRHGGNQVEGILEKCWMYFAMR